MVGLQVPSAVPHEGAHPVPHLHPGVRQGVGQLVGPVPGFRHALAAHAVGGGGYHFHVRLDVSAAVHDVGHEQGRLLHGHGVISPG